MENDFIQILHFLNSSEKTGVSVLPSDFWLTLPPSALHGNHGLPAWRRSSRTCLYASAFFRESPSLFSSSISFSPWLKKPRGHGNAQMSSVSALWGLTSAASSWALSILSGDVHSCQLGQATLFLDPTVTAWPLHGHPPRSISAQVFHTCGTVCTILTILALIESLSLKLRTSVQGLVFKFLMCLLVSGCISAALALQWSELAVY